MGYGEGAHAQNRVLEPVYQAWIWGTIRGCTRRFWSNLVSLRFAAYFVRLSLYLQVLV